MHGQVSVTIDMIEVMCILMQDVDIWNNSIKICFYNIFFYQLIMMWKPGMTVRESFSYNSKFTLTSKIAGNKHGHYKDL